MQFDKWEEGHNHQVGEVRAGQSHFHTHYTTLGNHQDEKRQFAKNLTSFSSVSLELIDCWSSNIATTNYATSYYFISPWKHSMLLGCLVHNNIRLSTNPSSCKPRTHYLDLSLDLNAFKVTLSSSGIVQTLTKSVNLRSYILGTCEYIREASKTF